MRKDQFESRVREVLPEAAYDSIKLWTQYAQQWQQTM